MVRMIENEASGKWQIQGISWEKLREGAVITKEASERLYRCLCKLKDYEEIGLNPDEVQSLLYQMSDVGAYVCDKLCRYPHEVVDQEEMDCTCEGCQIRACMDRIEEML